MAEAHQPPPVPDVGESSWCDVPNPATPLVGPWVQPRDLQHGLELLEHVQQVRRLRRLRPGTVLAGARSPKASLKLSIERAKYDGG